MNIRFWFFLAVMAGSFASPAMDLPPPPQTTWPQTEFLDQDWLYLATNSAAIPDVSETAWQKGLIRRGLRNLFP